VRVELAQSHPLPVRAALARLMFASLLMCVAVEDAFGHRAWLFVTGYLVLQVGRCAFLIVALRGRPQSDPPGYAR